MSTADYLFGGVLGEGAYAHVVLAQKKKAEAADGDGEADGAPPEELAIKIMDKAFLEKEGKVKYAMMERDALLRCASSERLQTTDSIWVPESSMLQRAKASLAKWLDGARSRGGKDLLRLLERLSAFRHRVTKHRRLRRHTTRGL